MTSSAVPSSGFYGPALARVHHYRFGRLAEDAAAHLLAELARRGCPAGAVVDLGCGSGILARRVEAAGFDVTGVDVSADMIGIARQQAPKADFHVASLYDVPLPTGCVAVTAIGEALNYAVDPRAGLGAFSDLAQRVHSVLTPGGMFVMDVTGPSSSGSSTQRFHRAGDWCLGMVATEAVDSSTLTRDISVFAANPDGTYGRSDERHVLRLIRRQDIETRLRTVGFDVEIRRGYDDRTLQETLPGWYVVIATKPEHVRSGS